MSIIAGLTIIQRYAAIGLAAALAVSLLGNALITKAWLGARDDVAAAIASCNADKLESIADAEKIVRVAEREAADARIRQMEVRLALEVEAADNERQARAEAQFIADQRGQQLHELAQESFDEDELPDSNACLNAFITSRALRCVLHARDQDQVGAGAGAGDDSLCQDPGGADGVHTGFSNVTFLDGLLYWGGDRDAAIRLNGRLSAIEKIQGEAVNGDGETE